MKKVINENTIRQIISEVLSSLMLEWDVKDVLGTNGDITDAELLKPKDFMKTTYALYRKCLALPAEERNKINIDKIFKDDPGYIVWQNYAKNMLGQDKFENIPDEDDEYVDNDGDVFHKKVLTGFKPDDKEQKFPKTARKFFDWLKILKHGGRNCPYRVFRSGGNCLFGFWNHGYFVISHIATESKFGMVRVIGDIAKYSNVIFAVTLDMASMLSRIGLITDGDIHQVPYNGEMADKMIFATSEEALSSALFAFKMLGGRRP